MDASFIIYTGPATTYIPIDPGQDLETILQNIDEAVNNTSAAPNYSGYNLYCITQTDGSTHPTNTQNFAEGISKIVCDNKDEYDTFVDTTYVTDQGVLTSAIEDLQDPALTYVPFSITVADSIQVVWSKVFTGLTAISAAQNPSSASWVTLSITPPTTITTGFGELITYLSTLTTTVSGKQASLGTFDNSANCLAGGATDSPVTTINLLRSYICDLPTFDPSGYTWGCVSTETTLDDTLQAIITTLTFVDTNFISTAGTGLTTGVTACGGTTVDIDTTWAGLYKVAVSAGDVASADYLEDKFTSLDGTVTIDTTTNPDMVDLSVTDPTDGKVKVESGGTADYLANKIVSTGGDWGISIDATVVTDTLALTPTMSNPDLFIQNFLAYISADQDLLTQFCALVAQCAGCSCAAPTGLTVEITTV